MPRCKHLNCTIKERFDMSLAEHEFENGKATSHNLGVPQINHGAGVQCADCGMDRYYHFRQYPRWLKDRLDEMGRGDTEVAP